MVDPDATVVRAAPAPASRDAMAGEPPADPDATVVRPGRDRPQVVVTRADADATVVRPVDGRRAPTAPPPRGARDATVVKPRADPDATVVRPLGAPAAPAAGSLPPLPGTAPLALQAGFRLHEYRIDGVLGQGGFGITYLATDVHLHAEVAIKEYLPEEIAFRAGDRSVSPNASRHRDRYRAGLDSFLVEARTLAAFRHAAIVRVARFFEAHRTAYMVLEYERGSPLKRWWPEHAAIGEKGLVELLLPLLDGLAVVHAAGVLHRDIKPDNIQVRADDGRLVLLDFGSAGQAVAVADQAAVVVTPGYAPLEQYGMGRQGPWTDIYALGATLYWCVAGKKPPDAEQRAAAPSSFVPAATLGAGRYGDAFLKAIDWALQSDPRQRPADIADWRRLLFADHLSSLGLQDALAGGDSLLEADTPLRRARRRLRLALHPADWPLGLKMALAMLATALLPMAATGLYNLRGSLAAVTDTEFRFLEQIAQSTAGRIAQFIDDSGHFAHALVAGRDLAALLDNPDEALAARVRETFVSVVAANPDVQFAMLMNAAGNAVVSSDAELVGRNFAFRTYFREAMAGRVHVTGLTVGAVAGQAGMFFAEPVKAADGRVLGALVLRMRGKAIAAIVDGTQDRASLTPVLIDADGVVIHHPNPAALYKSLAPLPPAALAAIRADQRFRRDTVDSIGETTLAAAMVGAQQVGHVAYRSALWQADRVAGYAPVGRLGWVMGVTESRAAFEAPLDRLSLQLLASMALIGLLFAGLGLAFARRIVRPVQSLTAAALALKEGRFDAAQVRVESRDELGRLARTFNVMIDVLRQRERERKR